MESFDRIKEIVGKFAHIQIMYSPAQVRMLAEMAAEEQRRLTYE